MEERLQKILSQSGFCSRRKAEIFLQEGRVTVNGTPAKLGDKADASRDTVCVDKKALTFPTEKTYLMLNKPRGYVTTLSDERGRKAVTDLVKDCGVRVWPVGRLDLDSEGLLVLTNDGDLTNKLTHPSYMVEKEYHTWVTGDFMKAYPILTEPMTLDGEHLQAAQVKFIREDGERTQLSIIIHEGKNRQVRRMCAAAGLEVKRLKRVREGKLLLDSKVPTGKWRALTKNEISVLQG